MHDERTGAPREGAIPATLHLVANEVPERSGSAKVLEFVDRRLRQVYPVCGDLDLPVRISPLGRAAGGPLADLAFTLGVGQVASLMSRIDRMHAANEEVLPRVKVADPCFDRDLALLYEPFEDGPIRRAAADEWERMLQDAAHSDPEAFSWLLSVFEGGPLPEHRTRVIQTALCALETVAPLTTALWAEALAHSGQNLRDYRITRNDFELLKSRYLDIFELAYHTLAFTARVANLARRGCATRHANGYRASLRQALEHSRTLEREQWLIDFPAATQLYGQLKRATRNDISHGRLRYDHARSQLVHRDGRRGNYLEFLIDYLHAVRLTHHLVDVVMGLGLASHELYAPPGDLTTHRCEL